MYQITVLHVMVALQNRNTNDAKTTGTLMGDWTGTEIHIGYNFNAEVTFLSSIGHRTLTSGTLEQTLELL